LNALHEADPDGPCISEHASVSEAARMMLFSGAPMLIAMDDQGRPSGVILRRSLSGPRSSHPHRHSRRSDPMVR